MNKRIKSLEPQTLLFFVILVLGSFLRLYKLGILPGGMYRDEVTVALNSINMFHCGTDFVGNVNPVYMTDWGDGHSPLYVWLTLIPLFFNKGIMTPLIARLPQAVTGILTLAAIYGIGKNTFGKSFGLWAMFITAVCPWHISMTRWGLDANLAPALLVFSLYFFIKGIEKNGYFILSALMYGLSLYTYAITCVVVPAILVMMAIYLLIQKKLKFNKYSWSAIFVLFIVALPTILFVLVNAELLPDIRLPFLSIIRMNGFRGTEVSSGFTSEAITNLKQAAHLFIFQTDAGEPWEIRLPWGLFYDIGRLFIVIGGIWLLASSIKSFIKRTFAWEVIFLFQVIGGGISCIAAYAHLHRINVLYIPLIFCGAYGIYKTVNLFASKSVKWANCYQFVIAAIFSIYLVLFSYDYTHEYKTLTEAYWGIGIDECVEMAIDECSRNDLKMITVEKGAQWPRLVLFTNTLAPEFTKDVIYESYPKPYSFVSNGITIQTMIDYEAITSDSVYIIYFIDYDLFKEDFELTKIYDWYVAVPKK